MKNKGFTLIELLAVIVILAIIALIAVPIIINIINDSREESYKRSIELYGKAVEQAIADYQINNPNSSLTRNDYTTSELGEIVNINYEGSRVVCSNIDVYEDGKIYMSGCSVGGHSVDGYTYGVEQTSATESESTYAYLWYEGEEVNGPSIGGDASSFATSVPTNKNSYLKYKLDSTNKVTNSYACVIYNSEEYCIEGGLVEEYGWDTDAAHSTGRVKKIYDMYENLGINSVCVFDDAGAECFNPANLGASLEGYVYSRKAPGLCRVYDDGTSLCGIDPSI